MVAGILKELGCTQIKTRYQLAWRKPGAEGAQICSGKDNLRMEDWRARNKAERQAALQKFQEDSAPIFNMLGQAKPAMKGAVRSILINTRYKKST